MPISGKKIILIVDDYEDDAVFLQLVLKKAGVVWPVVVIQDGSEALRYFKGQGPFADREKHPLPSILFLDLKMPSCEGFQIQEWLQQQPHLRSTLLVIIVTGDWEMRGVERAYALGAHSFLVKPCNPRDIFNLTKAFPDHWMSFPPPT